MHWFLAHSDPVWGLGWRASVRPTGRRTTRLASIDEERHGRMDAKRLCDLQNNA
jgi:hypothetical protein